MKKALWLIFILTALILQLSLYGQSLPARGIAVWAHPGDFGKNEKSMEEFFSLLEKSHVSLVVPLVKDMAGRIYWKSQRFPQAVHPDYRDFDLLQAITEVAHRHKIKVHAWLCDFTEGKDSPAFKLHPEWAMRNPQGGLTSDERLTPNQAYGAVWMCPVRRPGYTDEWLLPMIEEIVRRYPVDGIHHDYVRFPGDVAPDSYCFCDSCLENFWKYNLLNFPSRPGTRVPLMTTRLRQESNWDLGFTPLPADWAQMTREGKARFMLEGSSINRSDMDYFFYSLRSDAITRFVREAKELASKIRPGIECSAAVFNNPMLSGRFIGQRWTDFIPWLDILMPMNYRAHFQGSFEDYLIYLADTVRAQAGWIEKRCLLLGGLDAYYIFKEEREPWERALGVLKAWDSRPARDDLEKLMESNIAFLRKFSGSRAAVLLRAFESFKKTPASQPALSQAISAILNDPPSGFFPESKLLRAMDVVRKSGAQGIVIFSASHLTRNKLWPAVEITYSFEFPLDCEKGMEIK
jgi:uncharacterized lipoprotein YddW (UPF0748 family)